MIYTSLLLLTLLLPTLYSESLCGDGEVVDLDGSCVAKVIIPSRSSCPDLSLDNGDIFLVGSGRIVQFYCDTGYVRVPDTELAICQVQGAWSKVVPVCLKQGCQVCKVLVSSNENTSSIILQIPPTPSYGSITTSYNTTLSVFTCLPGYSMSGPAILACIDGHHWNGSAPLCEGTSIVNSVAIQYRYTHMLYILSICLYYVVTFYTDTI